MYVEFFSCSEETRKLVSSVIPRNIPDTTAVMIVDSMEKLFELLPEKIKPMLLDSFGNPMVVFPSNNCGVLYIPKKNYGEMDLDTLRYLFYYIDYKLSLWFTIDLAITLPPLVTSQEMLFISDVVAGFRKVYRNIIINGVDTILSFHYIDVKYNDIKGVEKLLAGCKERLEIEHRGLMEKLGDIRKNDDIEFIERVRKGLSRLFKVYKMLLNYIDTRTCDEPEVCKLIEEFRQNPSVDVIYKFLCTITNIAKEPLQGHYIEILGIDRDMDKFLVKIRIRNLRGTSTLYV